MRGVLSSVAGWCSLRACRSRGWNAQACRYRQRRSPASQQKEWRQWCSARVKRERHGEPRGCRDRRMGRDGTWGGRCGRALRAPPPSRQWLVVVVFVRVGVSGPMEQKTGLSGPSVLSVWVRGGSELAELTTGERICGEEVNWHRRWACSDVGGDAIRTASI